MTQTRKPTAQSDEDTTKSITATTRGSGGGATTAMRVIVPLQGVVQGRGGLVLGSVIPCALFYFLQFYLKRNRSGGPTTPPPAETTTSPSADQLEEVSSGLQRVQSRLLLSPRGSGSPAPISSRANSIVKQADGPYYVGLNRVSEDPYDETSNPDGIIQLGLAENKLSLDLVQGWLVENGKDAFDGQDLSIILQAVAGFMSQVMERPVSFNPSRIVLTAGATPAIEMLTFCLADAGNAYLVPSPYYPE
ncbi:unnamed protein product [Ilex paraguariensis]|uniref:Aminotransferase class I/classII large domain-containing protein n=1 Tax=Ilex paraguariensis TaxID=185542 RepID=A0ABC8QUK0_9AQUA